MFSSNAATAFMIDDIDVNVGASEIQLFWFRPEYKPEIYRAFVTCRKHNYTGAYSAEALTNDCSLKISGPHPGSECQVHFFAVYNRASLDRGMTFNVNMISKSTYMYRNVFYLRFIVIICLDMYIILYTLIKYKFIALNIHCTGTMTYNILPLYLLN